MGTLENYVHVFFLATAWTAFMTFYAASSKPAVSLSRIAWGYLVYGVSLGLLITFGWRALRMPVALLTIPCAGYGLFLLWSAKLRSRREVS